ncbi:hypothetical protein FXO37_35566 [Capsicum annuum]|nr:hypothetical protein FXO37_35566 [Capsicum annuum]
MFGTVDVLDIIMDLDFVMFGIVDDVELSGVKNVTLFSYKQLRIATDEFSPVNKIGEGGFGSVYKVCDGREYCFSKEVHLQDRPQQKTALATASALGDSILLIVALCFHSVCEEIAIGVADSQVDAWCFDHLLTQYISCHCCGNNSA